MNTTQVSDTWELGSPYEHYVGRSDGALALTARAWAIRATVAK